MATKSTRVPSELPLFDKYIKGAFNLLSAMVSLRIPPVYVWQLLGLTTDEMDKMKALYTEWWTGDPANPGAYELHTNAYTVSKTEDTELQVLDIINRFSAFFSRLLIRMEGSPNITSAYCIILHIAEPNPPHTKHTAEIIDSCFVKVIATQGEKVQFKCSSKSDSKRASIPAGQGDLQVETLLSVEPPTIDANKNVVPPLAPTGANDATLILHETSTKAAFYLTTIPQGSVAKTLQGYARWADIHSPKRKGPWTPIPPTLIN